MEILYYNGFNEKEYAQFDRIFDKFQSLFFKEAMVFICHLVLVHSLSDSLPQTLTSEKMILVMRMFME